MGRTLINILALLFGLQICLKAAVFFFVPYQRRRAALDSSYGGKSHPPSAFDTVTLAVAAGAAVLMIYETTDAASLLVATWVGATLTQLFFHRFRAPVADDRKAPEPSSPLKGMSYAIQAAPLRAWRELTMLVMVAIVLIARIGRQWL